MNILLAELAMGLFGLAVGAVAFFIPSWSVANCANRKR
jgi:hypothetical protein